MQGTQNQVRHYEIVAIEMPIYFNVHGDHDHNGLMFVLKKNLPILKYVKELSKGSLDSVTCGQLIAEAKARAQQLGIQLPQTSDQAKQPHPLVRPLVLRACKNETLKIQLENQIENRDMGIHLVSDGYSIQNSDGAHVGNNRSSLVPYRECRTYEWDCRHEGVFPFHDAGNLSGDEDGTNVHGLFGALVVEPEGAWWTDPDGHLFYLAAEGDPDTRGNKEPLFFRCRQHEVLELTLENRLPLEIAETAYDRAFPPCNKLSWLGECGLHVHLVKFDPICSDGASTGWNYISGPRAGKKMIYRWWADEEFGTIFFHDHLFANYRQKHGLFGALIVEPPSATFHDPYDLNKQIVSGQQAVIKLSEAINGVQAFREFCFGIGDWVPLFDRQHIPLEPPAFPGAHGDNGVMAVNYRCTPIRERPGDPAYWFHSLQHGDPDTSIFPTYPNEPIWIRLIQGSHEEQHSFQVHGMRWRLFRKDPGSPLRNQQTLGISEAFTFILNKSYGPGDYLWKLSGADDLWLGCWGLIRALDPEKQAADKLGRWPQPIGELNAPPPPLPTPPELSQRRRFKIVAEPIHLVYRKPDLVDPFGLIYRLTEMAAPGEEFQAVEHNSAIEPLVLRCRAGEWIEIELHNKLPEGLKLEPFAPEVPVENDRRMVSSQVSIHADLLRYDVRQHDGANVGMNPLQTVPPGDRDRRIYLWYADRELGPVLLQDMADFRNHRHHGLIGALIVESQDAVPMRVAPGEATASDDSKQAWYGTRATIRLADGTRKEEIVLLLQDGLRLFLNGNKAFPIPDVPADPGENAPDTEDQGQKGFNYRCEPVGDPDWLHLSNPATPTPLVPHGAKVLFRFVCAADKPRNHSFTIHGHTWPAWPHKGDEPRFASEAALSCGSVRTYEFEASSEPGDYAYRSGVLKWAVSQGLWGILRID